MTWNNRIVKRQVGEDPSTHTYGVHEVYYDDDGIPFF